MKTSQIIQAMDEKGFDIDKIVSLLYEYEGQVYTEIDVLKSLNKAPSGDLKEKLSEILGFVTHDPPLERRPRKEVQKQKKLLRKLKTADCQSFDCFLLSGEIAKTKRRSEPYVREPAVRPYKDKFIAQIHQNHRNGGRMTFIGLYESEEEAWSERERYALKHGLDDR